MSEDPFLQKKLDEAVRRQDEYLERRVEAGDMSAKRRRDEGAAEAAEAPVVPDPAPPAPAEGGRSRAASTVTCVSDIRPGSTVTCATDLANDVDIPIPQVSDPASSSTTVSPLKRDREVDDDGGDAERAREDRAEDPDDPKDEEMGMPDALEVLMLGQKRPETQPMHEAWEDGKYDLFELFSRPLVTKVATEL